MRCDSSPTLRQRNGKYNKVRDPDRASTRDWNALDQYCSNVALKYVSVVKKLLDGSSILVRINTKLGGTNSIFRSPSAEKCLVHSMVVGQFFDLILLFEVVTAW